MARKSSRGSYAIVMGILLIIMGVFLAIGGFGAAKSILNWFVLVIGIVLVIYGVLSILAGLLLFGIIEIVIGIVIAAMASQFAWIALIVLAVAFIVYAIQDLVRGRFSLSSLIELLIGVAVILVAFGVEYQWSGTLLNVFFIVSGVLMAVDGVLLIVHH
jgi:hypothetical protein